MRLEAGISERRGGVTRYQSSDIKNATAQVSSSQTVVGAKQYDAFGNLTSSSGSWNGPFSYGGAFGYQTEADTGYQLLGHRYYDPTTGRFLTRDPIGDGRNWYTYCGNNPVRSADPDGNDYIVIVAPKTGSGTGRHLHLGIGRDPSSTPHSWFGFYPTDPNGPNASSSKRSSGKGHVAMGDRPKDADLERGDSAHLLVAGPKAKELYDEIIRQIKEGRARKPYSLDDYNCADWVIELLDQFGFATLEFGQGTANKPKRVVDSLMGEYDWSGGLPWIRPTS